MTTFAKLTLTLATFCSFALVIFSQSESTHARLIACDVGQGDALLVIKGSTQILVDGGPSRDKILACLSRHIPFWDHTLELVVFTNTDYDHLAGLIAVLPRYRLGQLVTGDGIGESEALAAFRDVLRDSKISVSQVGAGDSIRVGQGETALQLRVLWPPHPNPAAIAALDPNLDPAQHRQALGISLVTNTNDRSVVLELENAGVKALLTGDIGTVVEQDLLTTGSLRDIDILKVGHHGSKYSTSQQFLEILRPEIAIISVGRNNRYGHPTSETLSRLSTAGAQVLRTDQLGEVIVSLESSPN